MSVTYETSFTMRGATGLIIQRHQILHLPRKIAFHKSQRNFPKTVEVSFTVRGGFDHDPSMIRTHTPSSRTRPFDEVTFRASETHFVLKNYNMSRSGYLPRFHQILRLPRKVTLQDHQILRLPRKVTLQDHQILRLARKRALHHQLILDLPRKVTLQLS